MKKLFLLVLTLTQFIMHGAKAQSFNGNPLGLSSALSITTNISGTTSATASTAAIAGGVLYAISSTASVSFAYAGG
jgi:hypothetical protein